MFSDILSLASQAQLSQIVTSRCDSASGEKGSGKKWWWVGGDDDVLFLLLFLCHNFFSLFCFLPFCPIFLWEKFGRLQWNK
jgi:hypothetical protein